MKRGNVVALSSLGMLSALSGCSTCFRNVVGTRTPAGMDVDTESWSGGFVGFDDPDESNAEDYPYGTVVTSKSDAKESIWGFETESGPRDHIDFIEATDFEGAYLIAMEWCCQTSSGSVEATRIERRGQGLHVSANAVVPYGTTASDASSHTLFIRVADDEKSIPEDVTFAVDSKRSLCG